MSQEKIPCKLCGGDAVIDKQCGDNGSSFNGVEFRLECSKCGHNEVEWFRSSIFAVGDWESKNKVKGGTNVPCDGTESNQVCDIYKPKF